MISSVANWLGTRGTAARADDLLKLRRFVDAEVTSKACQGEMIVEAAATPSEYNLQMLDPVTGADKAIKVEWNSALTLRKLKTRVRPCGYWLSASSKTAVERLRLHGVQVLRVLEPSSMLGDMYRETARSAGTRQDVRGSITDAGQIVKTEVAPRSLSRGRTPNGYDCFRSRRRRRSWLRWSRIRKTAISPIS